MIIAIDGPAGSGKSTTARIVAGRLNYLYLDTGAMYRAVALAFLRAKVSPTEEGAERLLPSIRLYLESAPNGLRILLNDDDVTAEIRRPEVTVLSSRVAALASVRRKMVQEQRRIAARYQREGGGVVLDGRDIGTVVFPDADVKVFLTASEHVRARRRFEELAAGTEGTTLDQVREDIRSRDERDATRAEAPLRKAEDAIAIDTTNLNVDEQVDLVIQAVKERDQRSAV